MRTSLSTRPSGHYGQPIRTFPTLLAIYYNIRSRFSLILSEDEQQKRVDKGLLFLSSSMFVWVISGCWGFAAHFYSFEQLFVFQIGINLLSIANNMFLLLAISYFYYAPSFIYKNERNVTVILLIIIGVTLTTLAISYFIGDQSASGINYNAIPDLLLSAFLSYLLLIGLYKTFIYRGLKIVAYLSSIIILLIFGSQLPDVFVGLRDDFTNHLIKIIAKTSLISIFLVLATTWVIQLANTPRVVEMSIQFLDWSLIQLSIPSKGIDRVQIDFGSRTTQYKNLLKFAVRRKFAPSNQQAIEVNSGGEIKSQTYLSRIIENMEIGHDKEGHQKLERSDIFTFLGNGMYRLRFLPEHIKIEPSLLSEFVQNPDNETYKDFV